MTDNKFAPAPPDNDVLEAARRRQAAVEDLALWWPAGSICYPKAGSYRGGPRFMVQQCKWEPHTNSAAVEVCWFDRHWCLHVDTFTPELLSKAPL
jgi:hypothetical protein